MKELRAPQPGTVNDYCSPDQNTTALNEGGFLIPKNERNVQKMTDKQFISLCKEEIKNYANKHLDKTDGIQITTDDVSIVWICKTLQNNKALVSTTLNDGMYYEVTHNGDKNETYIDCYKKWDNFVV